MKVLTYLWPESPISELGTVTTGTTPPTDDLENYGGNTPFVTPGELDCELPITCSRLTLSETGKNRVRLLRPGAILVCCIGSLGKVGIAGTELATNQQINSVEFNADFIDDRFAYHALKGLKPTLERIAPATTVPIVNKSRFAALKIPVPPLVEQKRIAAILDKADALRRKREQAIKLADEFLRSLFFDMFGDPVRNPKGWEIFRLADLLSIPLRNGISPSSDGTFTSRVLTLSAITGQSFDSQASKVGLFAEPIRPEKFADARDFLVCRGNGNIGLVGRAKFPMDVDDIAFPDTMIAARISDRCEPKYIAAIWDTPCIRNQIESGARTTNGTFKINQQLLESITFPVPPIKLQRVFSNAASTLLGVKEVMRHQSETDLIASLSQRAFRGEL